MKKTRTGVPGVCLDGPRFCLHRLLSCCTLFLSLLTGPVALGADSLDRSVSLEIPADTSLEEALTRWGTETGVQVMMDSGTLTQRKTQGIHGTQSALRALTALLQNSGFSYTIDDSTVHVVPVGLSAAPESKSPKDNASTKRAAAGSRSTQDNTRQSGLEEVIVTAQKRAERLQDVPISITALNEQDLERAGTKNMRDLVRTVPNLTLQSTAGGSNFIAIRGVTSNIGSPTVGIYIDETPVQVYQHGFQTSANPEVFDLDRIEVLRGPQGTLYGASSMGGTLRFITKQPSLTKSSGRAVTELSTTHGGDPSWQVAGAAGGPIVDNALGYRASVVYRTTGGYIDKIDRVTGQIVRDNINDERVIALRGALTAKLGDFLDATLSTFYQQIERDDLPGYDNPPGPFKQSLQVARPGRDYFILPSLKLDADLGSISFTSITSAFRRRDRQIDDYSSLVPEFFIFPQFPDIEEPGGAVNIAISQQRNVSQEIRFASTDPAARLKWVVGGFYQTSKLRFYQALVEHGVADLLQATLGQSVEEVLGLPLLPGDLTYLEPDTRVDEDQLAGFGEINFKLTPIVELVAGVRISRDKTTTRVFADGALNGGPTSPEAAAPHTLKETPVTPRFGLNFHLNPDSLLYATISRGFRTGGGNFPVPAALCASDLAALGLTDAPSTYSSDKTKNYELGYKGSLAQRRIGISASAFRIDWTNIQQNISLTSCGNFNFIGNLGKARSQGFDLDLQLEPLTGLLISGAVGFADAKFTQTLSLGPGSTIVSNGDRVPFTPKWTASVSVEKRVLIGDGSAYLRANYEYRGDVTRTQKAEDVAADPATYRQSSYGYLTSRLGFGRGRWDLALFVDNMLDAKPILVHDPTFYPSSGLRSRETSLRPRTVGLALAAVF